MQVHTARSSRVSPDIRTSYLCLSDGESCLHLSISHLWALHMRTQQVFCPSSSTPWHLYLLLLCRCDIQPHMQGGRPDVLHNTLWSVAVGHWGVCSRQWALFIKAKGLAMTRLELLTWIRIHRCFVLLICGSKYIIFPQSFIHQLRTARYGWRGFWLPQPAGNWTHDPAGEEHKVRPCDLLFVQRPHSGNYHHLSDGKTPKGPERINGIVVADCNYNERVCRRVKV